MSTTIPTRWRCQDCGQAFRPGDGTHCADCGQCGQSTGHMGCQYPKDRP